MAKQSFSKSGSFNKKWIFICGLVFLTIGLMFFFKQKGLKYYVEKQTESIADFYAQNLEPLFSKSQLSKEDVFNFAFYKELPMDKQNHQVLQLGNEINGKEYFEFRNAQFNPKTNNLDQFKGLLGLTEKQKHQLDSILNSYKDKIQTQVLVNDKNTLAINSNLWNLNKALMADLLLFASKANKNKFKEVFPEEFYAVNDPSTSKMVSEVNSFNNNKYIFVHSDTIFTREFTFNSDNLDNLPSKDKEDSRVRIKFDSDLAKTYSRNSQKQNSFDVTIDSNYCRVQVPVPPVLHGNNIPDMHRLNAELEKAARQLKNISVKFRTPIPPVPPGGHIKIHRNADAGSQQDFELNIDLSDIDSIVQAAISSSLGAVGNVNINLDSLSIAAQHDSMMTKEEKAKLKKEMQKLKIQLNKMKKNNRLRYEDNNGGQ